MWNKRSDSVFHSRLAQACTLKGLKITPFTKAQGISSATVSDWKSGVYPGSDIVLTFAETLGVSTDFLLGLIDTIQPSTALSADESTLLSAWRQADPVLRVAALRVLRTQTEGSGGTSSRSGETDMPDAL